MLNKYVPRPNTMDMGAMFMDGVPSVVGAGNDSNNYLDQRNERNLQRSRHTSSRPHLLLGRPSEPFATLLAPKTDSLPQNLPGFGLNHDNLSQNAGIVWTRVLSPRMVNTASIAFSRLAMTHFEENAYTQDIISELGIQGVGFGGPRAWGAPYFNVQGYSAIRRYLPGHAHAKLGHHGGRPRHLGVASW